MQTEREFKIGNNTISFIVESHPFQEARFRRFHSLAANILKDEQQLERTNPKKETRSKESPVAAPAGEEGEIIDTKESSASRSSFRSGSCKEASAERKDRLSYNRSMNERHRSRSPTAKRKRSPSIEHRYLRSHPSSRNNDRPSTLRNARSSSQKRDTRYKISSSSRSRRPNRRWIFSFFLSDKM